MSEYKQSYCRIGMDLRTKVSYVHSRDKQDYIRNLISNGVEYPQGLKKRFNSQGDSLERTAPNASQPDCTSLVAEYFVQEWGRYQLSGPAAEIKYSTCEETGLHLPGICGRVWDSPCVGTGTYGCRIARKLSTSNGNISNPPPQL